MYQLTREQLLADLHSAFRDANELDQYMKRVLCCRHYGRYVDDCYVVSADKKWLHSLIPKVRTFLKMNLQLTLHEGKISVCPMQFGAVFL